MSDYPRDLRNAAGEVREFKSAADVPPGWFVRDTGEEVNPAPVSVDADPPPPRPSKKKPKRDDAVEVVPLDTSVLDGDG